jgi:hypothetical protein
MLWIVFHGGLTFQKTCRVIKKDSGIDDENARKNGLDKGLVVGNVNHVRRDEMHGTLQLGFFDVIRVQQDIHIRGILQRGEEAPVFGSIQRRVIHRTAVIPEYFRTCGINATGCEFVQSILDRIPDALLEFTVLFFTPKGDSAEIGHVFIDKIIYNPPHPVVSKPGCIICGESLDEVIHVKGIRRPVEPAVKFPEIPEQLPPARLKHPGTLTIDPQTGMAEHSLKPKVSYRPIVLGIPWDKRTDDHVGVEKMVLWH